MPIILLIAVGYYLKQIGLFDQNFFSLMNKLSFRCCLPCLLFYNIYNVDNLFAIKEYGSVCLFAVIFVLAFFLIALLIVNFTIKDDCQKGIMIQCVYRSNYAIIGISLAMSISSGDIKPVVAASIISSVSIPLFNILATIALSLYVKENGKKETIASVIKKITNPLILGVFAGFVCLFIKYLIPVSNDGNKYFTIRQNLP